MALPKNRSLILSLLLFLLILCFQLSFQQPFCHESERFALVQFKNSFLIEKKTSFDIWKNQGIDCCSWEGITCDHRTGHVIGLDLSSSSLFGSINSSSSLFHLGHLQSLNLAFNDFNFSEIPPALGNLSRLAYLNLSESWFSGQVPFEISKLSKLTTLDLSSNIDYSTNQRLLKLKTSHWKSLIQNLSKLEYLNMSSVNINSPIPFVLANLSSLTHLSLQRCGLFGKFPNNIFELSNLEKLFVPDNLGLTGVLPEFHFRNPLKDLDVSDTSFSGELPKSLGLLSSLEYLGVENCNLSGVLPSSLSNLTNLHYLSLGKNSFQGSMAPFLSNLTQLDVIDLGFNQFTFKEIPSFARSIHLRLLDLSSNQISGPFPSWLTNLTQLTFLSLFSNMIQGSLPSSISKLENLESFYLGINNLSGTVELDTFFRLEHLKHLYLSFNSFSLLNISTSNITIPKFVYLELVSCNLKEFPAFLHNQDKLEILILPSNNIHGYIPKWLLMSPNLSLLDLSNNSLTSFEDFDIIFTSSLVILELSFNLFNGSLPIPPPSILCYSVASNSFDREIPPELCNMTSLEYLNLSLNNLSGIIPKCLGNQSKSLSNLNLGQNNFRGKLPRSLANCKNLEVLDLSKNQISDTFPLWLGALPLKILILQSNGFYGAIYGDSESDTLFPELGIIDLSHNKFQGPLPLKYFQRWNVLANFDAKKSDILGCKVYYRSEESNDVSTFLLNDNNKQREGNEI